MKPSIIAIASLKGGVGKTVSSIYSAAALYKRGLPVTVIDADSEGSSLNWAMGDLPFNVVAMESRSLGKQARALKDLGHFVVIDCSPDRDVLLMAAMAADYVLCPTSVSQQDINRLMMTLELLLEVQQTRNMPYLTSILLTRWQRNRVLSREFTGAFEAYPILESKISHKTIYQSEFGVLPSYTLEYSNVMHEVLSND